MNKAFCREPDQSRAVRCPACGSEGLVVSTETLAAHVAADVVERLGEPLAFCATDIGLTADDVDADIVAGSVERVRDVVRRAGQPGAECGLRAADGRSCTARVQRYYLRRRAELTG